MEEVKKNQEVKCRVCGESPTVKITRTKPNSATTSGVWGRLYHHSETISTTEDTGLCGPCYSGE